MSDISTKLTYLDTTKQLLKTEINKINNVLTDNSTFRSYPQELFNGYLDILNNGTDTLWNNLEKVSQTGTEAALEGVETAPIKMVLNGNTSQDGTPTPDTPVDIQVVTGENVVSVQGKQLLDTSMYSLGSINGNTGQNEESSSVYRFDKYNEVKPNTTIYLLKHLCIYFYNENKGFISSNIAGNLTITTPPNTKYIRFRIFGADFSTFNPNDYMVSYTQETDFVPYSKTDYPINLGDIELCKINTYKDYFHKDSGKWYEHKEIGKKIFDGSEDETWQLMYGNTESYFYRYRYVDDRLASSDKSYFSNYYAVANPAISSTNTSQGLTIISLNELRIRYGVVDTIENFKTWLSTHNLIVYYVLATPIEEEITNTTLIEQLEAISNAKSVKDKTYITQTNEGLPFILDVEAIKEYEVN